LAAAVAAAVAVGDSVIDSCSLLAAAAAVTVGVSDFDNDSSGDVSGNDVARRIIDCTRRWSDRLSQSGRILKSNELVPEIFVQLPCQE